MSLLNQNKFLLGIFGINCESGVALTRVDERWKNSWQNNVAISKIADDAGIDFLLPVARWVGYGGEHNFHSNVLETTTWAAGLLSVTRNISVMITMHTAMFNPVVAAKQIATIDQMAPGRVGINVVAGWNEPEYRALGLKLIAEHGERYAFAQEWFDIVNKLWTSKQPFNHDGKFFNLENVMIEPKPEQKPFVMNAGGSGEGKTFAVTNADVLFTAIFTLDKAKADVEDLKKQAAARGREVSVLTTCFVVCRPTMEEAQAYLKHYVDEHADWDAVDRMIDLLFAFSKALGEEAFKGLRDRVAAGHGSYPLVGTPKQIADELIKMHEVGLNGTTIAFVDYEAEFPYFRDEVLPLLEQAGLRTPGTI